MAKFGGFGGGGNMQQMLKQAQKMQEQMKQAQAELDELEVTGTAGGGMVSLTMNGKKRVLGVSIKPEAVDPEDVEMLEDLIMAAYGDAEEKADKLYNEKMGAFAALGL